MKIEVNKIITLGNREKYLVIDKVVKDGKDYFYVAEVNDTETDVKDNYKIVEATYKDGKTLIDEVLGEDNLKTLLPLFVEKNKES